MVLLVDLGGGAAGGDTDIELVVLRLVDKVIVVVKELVTLLVTMVEMAVVQLKQVRDGI